MKASDNRDIVVLDKVRISTSEVVSYLESINVANHSIIEVLKRKPALPHYENLEWVINSKIDLEITKKLKAKISLSYEEAFRLKAILSQVIKEIKKLKRPGGVHGNTSGVEQYLNSIE